jgi:hypothetical protein
MKPVTVIDRKPRMGMDCRMSSSGTSTRSAVAFLAASTAKMPANSSEATMATAMRSVVRRK